MNVICFQCSASEHSRATPHCITGNTAPFYTTQSIRQFEHIVQKVNMSGDKCHSVPLTHKLVSETEGLFFNIRLICCWNIKSSTKMRENQAPLPFRLPETTPLSSTGRGMLYRCRLACSGGGPGCSVCCALPCWCRCAAPACTAQLGSGSPASRRSCCRDSTRPPPT